MQCEGRPPLGIIGSRAADGHEQAFVTVGLPGARTGLPLKASPAFECRLAEFGVVTMRAEHEVCQIRDQSRRSGVDARPKIR